MKFSTDAELSPQAADHFRKIGINSNWTLIHYHDLVGHFRSIRDPLGHGGFQDAAANAVADTVVRIDALEAILAQPNPGVATARFLTRLVEELDRLYEDTTQIAVAYAAYAHDVKLRHPGVTIEPLFRHAHLSPQKPVEKILKSLADYLPAHLPASLDERTDRMYRFFVDFYSAAVACSNRQNLARQEDVEKVFSYIRTFEKSRSMYAVAAQAAIDDNSLPASVPLEEKSAYAAPFAHHLHLVVYYNFRSVPRTAYSFDNCGSFSGIPAVFHRIENGLRSADPRENDTAIAMVQSLQNIAGRARTTSHHRYAAMAAQLKDDVIGLDKFIRATFAPDTELGKKFGARIPGNPPAEERLGWQWGHPLSTAPISPPGSGPVDVKSWLFKHGAMATEARRHMSPKEWFDYCAKLCGDEDAVPVEYRPRTPPAGSPRPPGPLERLWNPKLRFK
ncbi:MAG: hypothetical protein AB7H77_07960 [Bdellovibrionales bacterium]